MKGPIRTYFSLIGLYSLFQFLFVVSVNPYQKHFTMAGDQQQFCLRWNDFQTNMVSSFKHLRDEKSFTDVTLACDGQVWSLLSNFFYLSRIRRLAKVRLPLRHCFSHTYLAPQYTKRILQNSFPPLLWRDET